jgi:hypothetical protein
MWLFFCSCIKRSRRKQEREGLMAVYGFVWILWFSLCANRTSTEERNWGGRFWRVWRGEAALSSVGSSPLVLSPVHLLARCCHVETESAVLVTWICLHSYWLLKKYWYPQKAFRYSTCILRWLWVREVNYTPGICIKLQQYKVSQQQGSFLYNITKFCQDVVKFDLWWA